MFKLGFIRSLEKCFEYYIKLVSLCEYYFNYFLCLKGLSSIYSFGISFFMFRFQNTPKKYKGIINIKFVISLCLFWNWIPTFLWVNFFCNMKYSCAYFHVCDFGSFNSVGHQCNNVQHWFVPCNTFVNWIQWIHHNLVSKFLHNSLCFNAWR